MTDLNRKQGTLLGAGAVLLILWWFATGILLVNSSNFADSIMHPAWLPINIPGLLACILICLGLPTLLQTGSVASQVSDVEQKYSERSLRWSGRFGRWGLFTSQTGLILFASVQYYETFLWPVAAKYDKKLVESGGKLVFGDILVAAPLLASGLILTLGFLFLLLYLKRKDGERAWPWTLFAGALLFGSGLIAPVRTLGLLLFAGALIRYAIRARRS